MGLSERRDGKSAMSEIEEETCRSKKTITKKVTETERKGNMKKRNKYLVISNMVKF